MANKKKKTNISTIQVLKYKKKKGHRKNAHKVDFIFSCVTGGRYAECLELDGRHTDGGNSLYQNGELMKDIDPGDMHPWMEDYIETRLFAKDALKLING
mgnify:CR=1 FL=1